MLNTPVQATPTDTQTLPPITITATRTDNDTALASTTLITRNDIERLQYTTVAEALRGVAGISISNSGGLGKQTSLFMRGTNSNHILVLIDGVRVGSVSAGTTSFEFIPLAQVESIEVVRGPRASLYGSDAIGGIIHIRTRQEGNNTLRSTFTYGKGSHDHHRYGFSIASIHTDTWYNYGFSHEQSNGYDAKDDDRDGFRSEAYSARLGHRFSDRLTLEGNFLYVDGNVAYDGDWQNQTDFANKVIGGKIKIKPHDLWQLTLQGGNSRDHRTSKKDSTKKSVFNTERISLTVQNDLIVSPNHTLTIGYDYLNDRIRTTANFAKNYRYNHGYFSQYQAYIGDIEIILGGRYDDNEQFGNHYTKNATLGYQFKEIQILAAYATAYKAPTFNHLYWPKYSNPNLKAEQSRSFELGVSGQHDWGHWSLNTYYTQIKNLIALDKNYIPKNLEKSRIRGIELIVGRNFYGFMLKGNLTLLNPENLAGENKGKLLARRPEQTFRFDVDRSFNKLSLGASFINEGRRFDGSANTKRIGGFATLNLRAQLEITDNLVLQIKANNALDRHYRNASGYNQDKFNVFFNLRYNPILL